MFMRPDNMLRFSLLASSSSCLRSSTSPWIIFISLTSSRLVLSNSVSSGSLSGFSVSFYRVSCAVNHLHPLWRRALGLLPWWSWLLAIPAEFPGYLHPAGAGQSCQSFYTLLFGTCTFRALPATAAQVLSRNGRGGKQQDKPNPPVLYRLLNCSFPSAAFTPLKAALLCEDVSVFSYCILFVTLSLYLRHLPWFLYR